MLKFAEICVNSEMCLIINIIKCTFFQGKFLVNSAHGIRTIVDTIFLSECSNLTLLYFKFPNDLRERFKINKS